MGRPVTARRPDVAVVIPAFDAADLLADCLASLDPGGRLAEVVVVDNGSTDETAEVATAAGARLVRLETNRGFGAAVNAGAETTAAPFLFVLNVDTVVGPGCVDLLAGELARDDELGGVQPMILAAGTVPPALYSAGQRLLSDGRAYEEGAGAPAGTMFVVPREIFGVCGAASMIRRSMLEELGGYDETYFAFYEDVDLNARAQIRGWRFRYVPSATVAHVGGAVWRRMPDAAASNAYLVGRNRLATAVKVMPLRYAPRVAYAELASIVLGVGSRTFRATVSGKAAALRRLPRLLRERTAVARSGDREGLTRWFGEEGPWLGERARARVRPTADPRRGP